MKTAIFMFLALASAISLCAFAYSLTTQAVEWLWLMAAATLAAFAGLTKILEQKA